jgi:hypothetical protein
MTRKRPNEGWWRAVVTVFHTMEDLTGGVSPSASSRYYITCDLHPTV